VLGEVIVSRNDPSVSNSDVIPVFDSTVFAESPSALFATGILAIDGVPLDGLAAEYRAHYELRRRVYVDQTGQLDPSEIDQDGTDRDADDDRSVVFGVLENRGEQARMIGVSRLILKSGSAGSTEAGSPLPIETAFPDLFDPPLGVPTCEVSRFIARHESAKVQGLIQWHLIAQMLAWIETHDLHPTVAILEPWLERHLSSLVPLRRLAEPRYVEHYLDYNIPIEIDTARLSAGMGQKDPDLVPSYKREPLVMHTLGRTPDPAQGSAAS
jgi:hypothetical protein